MTELHCTNVLHNEISCMKASLPFEQYCDACKTYCDDYAEMKAERYFAEWDGKKLWWRNFEK